MGAGARSDFIRLRSTRSITYSTKGVNFGSRVGGPNRRFTTSVTNEAFFARRNAQLAWALHLRARRTERLVAGDTSIDPASCLFIRPSIARARDFLAMLSQPIYAENVSGKVTIQKSPRGAKSPNEFDAACLSYARDSQYGLRNR